MLIRIGLPPNRLNCNGFPAGQGDFSKLLYEVISISTVAPPNWIPTARRSAKTVGMPRKVFANEPDSFSHTLPAAEMRAAIDVQDVTGHRRRVGQVQDRIRDVLDRRRPAHRR